MSGRPNAVVPGVPVRPNSPRPRNRSDAPDVSRRVTLPDTVDVLFSLFGSRLSV